MDALMNLVNYLPALVTAVVYMWSRAKVAAAPNAKPGYKTTSFWLTAVINIATVLQNVWPAAK
jgi:hypothetical protein